MKDVRLHDLVFEPFITKEEITKVVADIAIRIDQHYRELNPVLLVVLNGAFIFAADLVRQLSIPLRLDFLKVSSYAGTSSSGSIQEHFLWKIALQGQHVIIIEDIVDTGHTLSFLKHRILADHPASLEVACLLKKPTAYQYPDILKYEGLSIPNDFVVGYGLDYDGLGRHLDCIYRKKDE
jgi:hypoxanthine phosphoribosyltransferase